MSERTLRVSEIFYSLAGEGARAGEASIFIRLSGCSAKHTCYAAGVICDTEFESGKTLTLDQVIILIDGVETSLTRKHPSKCKWLVFTGGEPLDQLLPEHFQYFKDKDYKIALETSGIKRMSQEMADCIDYITVSPKVAEHVLTKNYNHLRRGGSPSGLSVDELRYVRHAGQPGAPEPALKAQYYYLSPHSDGGEINRENLQHCIKLCLENPQWRLSVQQHKIWRLL